MADYFDCFSGISGDMAVAALLDLGVDAGELRRELEKLALPGYELEIRSGARKGIRCTEFVVNSPGEEHRHRRLDDILAIKALGCHGAIVGRALYEGRFTLPEAIATARRS